MFYSLKKLLLSEAVINQNTFFEKLGQIIMSKPMSFERPMGKIIRSHLVDSDGNFTIEKFGKKERVKLSKEIEKKIKECGVKSLSGKTISLKSLKQFYDEIIIHMKDRGDVDFDDCIIAATFFTEEYATMPQEDKKKIDGGNFSFEEVILRLNYYKQYMEDLTGLSGLKTGKAVNVYEDENVKVVYPTNPAVFNSVIKSYMNSKGYRLTWCTQRPETWFDYYGRFYVCIAINKRPEIVGDPDHPLHIVSLKVSKEGNVLYEDTCDRNNDHMSKEFVRQIISQEAEDSIRNFVSSGFEDYEFKFDAKPSDVLENIKMIASSGRVNELKFLIRAVLSISGEEYIEMIADGLLAIDFSEEDKINMLTEVIAEISFDSSNLIEFESYAGETEPKVVDYADSFSNEGHLINKLLEHIEELSEKIAEDKYNRTGYDYDADDDFEILLLDDEADDLKKVKKFPIEDVVAKVTNACFRKASKNRAHPQYAIAYAFMTVICKSKNMEREIQKSSDEINNILRISLKTNNAITFQKIVKSVCALEQTADYDIESAKREIMLSKGAKKLYAIKKGRIFIDESDYDNFDLDICSMFMSRAFSEESGLIEEFVNNARDEFEDDNFDIGKIEVNLLMQDFNKLSWGVLDVLRFKNFKSMTREEAESLITTVISRKKTFQFLMDNLEQNILEQTALILITEICNAIKEMDDEFLSGESFDILTSLIINPRLNQDNASFRRKFGVIKRIICASTRATAIESIFRILDFFDREVSDVSEELLDKVIEYDFNIIDFEPNASIKEFLLAMIDSISDPYGENDNIRKHFRRFLDRFPQFMSKHAASLSNLAIRVIGSRDFKLSKKGMPVLLKFLENDDVSKSIEETIENGDFAVYAYGRYVSTDLSKTCEGTNLYRNLILLSKATNLISKNLLNMSIELYVENHLSEADSSNSNQEYNSPLSKEAIVNTLKIIFELASEETIDGIYATIKKNIGSTMLVSLTDTAKTILMSFIRHKTKDASEKESEKDTLVKLISTIVSLPPNEWLYCFNTIFEASNATFIDLNRILSTLKNVEVNEEIVSAIKNLRETRPDVFNEALKKMYSAQRRNLVALKIISQEEADSYEQKGPRRKISLARQSDSERDLQDLRSLPMDYDPFGSNESTNESLLRKYLRSLLN